MSAATGITTLISIAIVYLVIDLMGAGLAGSVAALGLAREKRSHLGSADCGPAKGEFCASWPVAVFVGVHEDSLNRDRAAVL